MLQPNGYFLPSTFTRPSASRIAPNPCEWTVLADIDVPLSFVTTGQDVPDDIAPADPHRLADCIVGGPRHVAS